MMDVQFFLKRKQTDVQAVDWSV